jgi:hypothetical protein
MTKGNPWPVDDEKNLKTWFTSGTTDLRVLAFSFEGKYTEEAIRQKLIKLGLTVEPQAPTSGYRFTDFEMPQDMPSMEEALKAMCLALKALEKPGIEKSEVLRLRSIISGIKIYKELLLDYANYRGIEAQMLEMKKEIEELSKKPKNNAPQ